MKARLTADGSVYAAARKVSTALIACGFAAILAYAWTRADEALYQIAQRSYLPAVPPAVPVTAGDPLAESVSVAPRLPAVGTVLKSPLIQLWISPDPKVLGRLVIPKLTIDVVIREGTDAASLRRAVGHITGTAMAGSNGNFVITGHRDTFFRPLRNIANNDEILAITPGARHTYRVYAISVVPPDHVQVLRRTTQPECTLVTCFPFDYMGSAPRRFIVQARLVKIKN